MSYSRIIQQLITQLSKLPTIGPKTAERIVFAMLKNNRESIVTLGQSLIDLGQKVKQCSTCYNFAAENPCHVCADQNRDNTILCVVSEPQDLEALEKTNFYKGKYFVLNGTISTSAGKGPAEINVPALINRIKKSPEQITEVILAFDPDIEGETTVMYLAKALESLGVKTSRLARGLPVGADLEYADEVTLSAAIENRKHVT